MSKNIRKFTSQAAYDAYKAADGWDYPSVSFVETEIDSQVHYNNEFIMRWKTTDTNKVPSFYGEVSHDTFKNWVDHASRPCRVLKSDHTQQDVYTVTSNGSVSDWSQFSKTDTNYLHMTRIQNINVGCFQDTSKGIKEIRFNFDKGCPDGFHKWFPNATAADGSKLWGRYDITAVTTTAQAGSNGINCASGLCHNPNLDGSHAYDPGINPDIEGGETSFGNWRADYILAGCKSVGGLAMTYWEYYVLTMIFSAYYGTFDTQSIFHGLTNNYTTANAYGGAHQWTNGNTDVLMTPHGALTDAHHNEYQTGADQGYRFMHIENAIHGKQWLWGAGWSGKMTHSGGQYMMAFDDLKANADATLTTANAEYTSGLTVPSGDTNITNNEGTITGDQPWGRTDPKYVTDIDIYGVPCSIYLDGGSDYTKGVGGSTNGFYDALYSYNMTSNFDRVAYLGGDSYHGDRCGGFARTFHTVAAIVNWDRRGRVTMNA